jgi:hypothetical protein
MIIRRLPTSDMITYSLWQSADINNSVKDDVERKGLLLVRKSFFQNHYYLTVIPRFIEYATARMTCQQARQDFPSRLTRIAFKFYTFFLVWMITFWYNDYCMDCKERQA